VPTIRATTTNLAANGSAYPLQNNQYEYLPFNAALAFAIVANAAGIVATVFSGSDLLQQEGPVTVSTGPVIFPDHFLLEDVAMAGERLNVILRETAGVATTDIETVVRIQPL
jgi:hypothetical protein